MTENNSCVLNIISDKLTNPSFVIDESGFLKSYNESAAKLIPPDYSTYNFFELFDDKTKIVLKKLLTESIVLDKIISEKLDLIFKNSNKLKCDIIFSSYSDERNKYSLCTLNNIEQNYSGNVTISISTNEIADVIKSKDLLNIFEEIKSSFPFTLLGKNKIQREINKINDLFWLKDIEGKYLLVNQKFSEQLGLKTSLFEGRYEKEFLPQNLINLFESFNKFIEDSSNIIIKEGLTFPFTIPEQDCQFIEFPVCNQDNHVVAIVGISQQIGKKKIINDIAELTWQQSDIPLVVVDAYKKIIFRNQAGSEVFSSLIPDKLPEEISIELDNFLNIDDIKISKTGLNINSENQESLSVFVFRKLYNLQRKFEGVAIYGVIQPSEEFNILKNKGTMYEVLMQTSPEPMFIYDIDNLRFLDVNKATSDLYGYTKKEFLQMDLTDLYAPEDIQTLLDNSDSRNAEGVYTGPWRHKKKNGVTILVQISKASFEYKNKKAHFNIIKDVTEKIGGQKEIQLFKSTFNTVSDMIFITDGEGFIQEVNNPVAEVLGYSKEDTLDKPFITIVSDVQRVDVSNNIFYSNIKRPVTFECELKMQDSSALLTELSVTPLLDFENKITNFNIVAKVIDAGDKVDNKVIESKLEKHELQQDRSSTFDPAMLSSIFHEILTPMNVIIGFVQEIIDTIPELNSDQKEAADIISQNKIMLMQIMDSVMEFSHIEQKRVKIVPVKFVFTEILDNLLLGTKKLAEMNKIEIAYGKISSSLTIENDKARMEHLLSMLMSITLRLTKEKKLYLSAVPFDDGRFVVSIKDNRKAISKHLLDNLKNIYNNQNILDKEFGSSKLTLNLSRKLLALLGGCTQIIEKSGEAIEFAFLFPLKYESAAIEKTIEQISEQKIIKQEINIPIEIIPEKKEGKIITDNKEKIVEKVTQDIKKPEIVIPKSEPESEPESESELILQDPIAPEIQIPVDTGLNKVLEEKEIIALPKQTTKKKKELDFSAFSCLYVEDQVDSQILFKVQMKELKKIDNAVSFESALPLLQKNKYDFIVMDINLQGEYNGLDALRIIRRLPGYEGTKIIAVTAYVLPGDKEKFVSAGFNDFISKPLLRDKLTESIRKIMI